MRKKVSFSHFSNWKGKAASFRVLGLVWLVYYHSMWNRWEFVFGIRNWKTYPKGSYLWRAAITVEVGK